MNLEVTRASKIIIRPVQIGDLEEIRNIYNHAVRTSVATLDLEERTYEDMLSWFRSHTGRYVACVGISNSSIIGFGSLSKWAERQGYSISSEVSIYLSKEYVGLGYGNDLLTWLIKQAQKNGFTTIICFMTSTNKRSEELFRRNKFSLVGNLCRIGSKFDKLIDISIYQLMIDSIHNLNKSQGETNERS